MLKLKIAFETKKGCVVETLWCVRQIGPRPDFEGCCGGFRWRNYGGLIPQWRPCDMEKPSIGRTYWCDLLRSDKENHDQSTRVDHAGYVPDQRDPHPAPGTFTLRGVDMGEMNIVYENGTEWPAIRVRGFQKPTEGERAFIKQHIHEKLALFIRDNAMRLKAAAIEDVRECVRSRCSEARASLNKLEKEMNAAIDAAE
jgi:hypothetical protein